MENVYFEDDAGVSLQWLAVRVRGQGGLIPALYLYSDLNYAIDRDQSGR